MNIVGLSLEMLFLPLSMGIIGAAICVWRDRKAAIAKLHKYGTGRPTTKLV